MKRVVADPEFFELFPDAGIGVLCITNAEHTEISSEKKEEIANVLAQANALAKKYVPNEPISANPVVQVWREAYRKFPGKKGARCAIENLLKRVLKGNPVQPIHPSVDVTNAISLKYAFPIGVEDYDAIAGDLRLGIMQGGEEFIPIGEEESDPAREGELAYYDEVGVVCRNFNWRDGKRTQVTDNTKVSIVAMECLEKDRFDDLQAALDELSGLFSDYLGATVHVNDIITKDHPSVDLTIK